MRYLKLFITILIPALSGAQPLDSLLQQVEQNNPRLKALHKWLEAEETLAKTGIFPDNPEIITLTSLETPVQLATNRSSK